jgi:hypothetical protein
MEKNESETPGRQEKEIFYGSIRVITACLVGRQIGLRPPSVPLMQWFNIYLIN